MELLQLLQAGVPSELEYSETHAPLVHALKAFSRSVQDNQDAAEAADQTLSRAIRKHNHARDLIAMNDGIDRAFFVGRCLGFPDEEILPIVELSASTAETRLVPTYEALGAISEVSRTTDQFLGARERLLETLAALQELTDAPGVGSNATVAPTAA